MLRFLKTSLLALSLLALTSCEEVEELNARKRVDEEADAAKSTRLFQGLFTPEQNSLAPCPTGSGAIAKIHFSKEIFDFTIPETDANGPSPYLQQANVSKAIEGMPTLETATGNFSAVFIMDDAGSELDLEQCAATGDTYAFKVRFSIAGAVNVSRIDEAAYEITNVCTNETAAPVVCSGAFSAFETAND